MTLPSFAAETEGPKDGQFYLAPGAVWYSAPDENPLNVDSELGPGLIFGYGLTDKPEDITAYSLEDLCADLIGMLDALVRRFALKSQGA